MEPGGRSVAGRCSPRARSFPARSAVTVSGLPARDVTATPSPRASDNAGACIRTIGVRPAVVAGASGASV